MNIWYSKEEMNNLENILEQLMVGRLKKKKKILIKVIINI